MKQKHELMTTLEVSRYFRISRKTFLGWVRRGVFKPIRIPGRGRGGNDFRFWRKDIETFVERGGF